MVLERHQMEIGKGCTRSRNSMSANGRGAIHRGFVMRPASALVRQSEVYRDRGLNSYGLAIYNVRIVAPPAHGIDGSLGKRVWSPVSLHFRDRALFAYNSIEDDHALHSSALRVLRILRRHFMTQTLTHDVRRDLQLRFHSLCCFGWN